MLLQKGIFENFLTGLGRLDLVMAAQEARKFPDPDRALDTLLERLPCDAEALAPPQLQVESTEINLGTIEAGEDRMLEIRLENSGERLLYGNVTVQVPAKQQAWLRLDEKPGTIQRVIQFQEHMVLPVRLERDRVRASDKPLEATLLIDSSGGTATIRIRADVPVKAFPEAALKGARSPRELAQLAKKSPKDAAPLFESGAVLAWYASNGWEYPVQGPASSGLAGIQQFFEALGLVKAPLVKMNKKRIEWSGSVGDTFEQEIVVTTDEKKPVHAHGTSDHPWLVVERAEVKGQKATIRVRVPQVPNSPGETLKATLTVQSNGDQRFFIPVSLAVGGRKRATPSSGAFNFDDEVVSVVPIDDDEPVTVVAIVEDEPVTVVAVANAPALAVVYAVDELTEVEEIQPIEEVHEIREIEEVPSRSLRSEDRPTSRPETRTETRTETRAETRAETRPELNRTRPEEPDSSRSRRSKPLDGSIVKHLMPLVVLLFALGSVFVWDYLNPPVAGVSTSVLPGLEVAFSKTTNSRFGLSVVDPTNSRGREKENKALSPPAGPTGETSTVCLRVGGEKGSDFMVGGGQGAERMVSSKTSREGGTFVFRYPQDEFEVTQEVRLIKGPTDTLDTALIRYTIKNTGRRKQMVGLRVLLDTYIGSRDDVPFLIPGTPGFVTTQKVIGQKDLPQYIEAVENPKDPNNPGTVVRVGLKFPGSKLEEPSEVFIGGYQNGFNQKRWDVPRVNIDGDSLVLLYWPETDLNAGESRTMGYSYGLAEIVADGSLALSAPAVVPPSADFVLTAYVYKAKKGTPYKLLLPKGLTLADKENAEKTVDADGERVTMTWRVRAGVASDDSFQIRLEGGGATSAPVKVKIQLKSIFG